MKKTISFKTLIFVILLCSGAGAEVPDYYVQKQTWPETMRASREKLLQLEESGELGMPLTGPGKFRFYHCRLDKNRFGNRRYYCQGPRQKRLTNTNQGSVP